MFPFVSLSGPLLAATLFRGFGADFFIEGGLNSRRNADFFFPLEREAPFVLTDGLDVFFVYSEDACMGCAAITRLQAKQISVTRNTVECVQWRNYRSLRAFCFAFKIGFSR